MTAAEQERIEREQLQLAAAMYLAGLADGLALREKGVFYKGLNSLGSRVRTFGRALTQQRDDASVDIAKGLAKASAAVMKVLAQLSGGGETSKFKQYEEALEKARAFQESNPDLRPRT